MYLMHAHSTEYAIKLSNHRQSTSMSSFGHAFQLKARCGVQVLYYSLVVQVLAQEMSVLNLRGFKPNISHFPRKCSNHQVIDTRHSSC